MFRWLWVVFAVTSLVLGTLGVAGLLGWFDPPPPDLAIAEPVCDLGDVEGPGTAHASFRVRNCWNEPIHILGYGAT
jgi:hypothetical protein